MKLLAFINLASGILFLFLSGMYLFVAVPALILLLTQIGASPSYVFKPAIFSFFLLLYAIVCIKSGLRLDRIGTKGEDLRFNWIFPVVSVLVLLIIRKTFFI